MKKCNNFKRIYKKFILQTKSREGFANPAKCMLNFIKPSRGLSINFNQYDSMIFHLTIITYSKKLETLSLAKLYECY